MKEGSKGVVEMVDSLESRMECIFQSGKIFVPRESSSFWQISQYDKQLAYEFLYK